MLGLVVFENQKANNPPNPPFNPPPKEQDITANDNQRPHSHIKMCHNENTSWLLEVLVGKWACLFLETLVLILCLTSCVMSVHNFLMFEANFQISPGAQTEFISESSAKVHPWSWPRDDASFKGRRYSISVIIIFTYLTFTQSRFDFVWITLTCVCLCVRAFLRKDQNTKILISMLELFVAVDVTCVYMSPLSSSVKSLMPYDSDCHFLYILYVHIIYTLCTHTHATSKTAGSV